MAGPQFSAGLAFAQPSSAAANVPRLLPPNHGVNQQVLGILSDMGDAFLRNAERARAETQQADDAKAYSRAWSAMTRPGAPPMSVAGSGYQSPPGLMSDPKAVQSASVGPRIDALQRDDKWTGSGPVRRQVSGDVVPGTGADMLAMYGLPTAGDPIMMGAMPGSPAPTSMPAAQPVGGGSMLGGMVSNAPGGPALGGGVDRSSTSFAGPQSVGVMGSPWPGTSPDWQGGVAELMKNPRLAGPAFQMGMQMLGRRPEQRRTATDAAGHVRYLDTGERVFPGVEAPRKPPRTDTRVEGNDTVNVEWDDASGQWVETGRGPRFAPRAGDGPMWAYDREQGTDVRVTEEELRSNPGRYSKSAPRSPGRPFNMVSPDGKRTVSVLANDPRLPQMIAGNWTVQVGGGADFIDQMMAMGAASFWANRSGGNGSAGAATPAATTPPAPSAGSGGSPASRAGVTIDFGQPPAPGVDVSGADPEMVAALDAAAKAFAGAADPADARRRINEKFGKAGINPAWLDFWMSRPQP